MSIIRLFLELFVLYILYKLVFELIIPVFNTTRQVKQKMNEMHQKMQQQQDAFNKTEAAPTATKHNQGLHKEDYIEYEEIK